MKTKKRCTLLLTMALLVSSVSPMFSSVGFAEAPAGDDPASTVKLESDGAPVQRGEAAKLAVRLYERISGKTIHPDHNPFTDTDDVEINKAHSAGIVMGIEDGKFGPDAVVSKQELSTMLYRVMENAIDGFNGDQANQGIFADKEEIAGWAELPVRYLHTLGVIKADSSEKVNPHAKLDLQEANDLAERIYGFTVARNACSKLDGRILPASDIRLPTSGATIQSASLVLENEESNVNGEFCKVLGAIHPVDQNAPDILFEINLPTQWNHKTLQLGGGGFNGTLITGLGGTPGQMSSVPMPLKQGYVTFGSDSGHQSTVAFDASFGLNKEALNNFAGDQLKKTYDVAITLVKNHYGKAPEQKYFAGSSEGGREALTVVQRWPGDYDGVIAFYPVVHLMLLHLTDNQYAQALYANDGAGWLNPEKYKLLNDAVYQACDGLDGVVDGIIGDVKTCSETFTIKTVENTLRCPDGADTGNDCLSDAQIHTVRVMSSPMPYDFTFNNGVDSFPQSTILLGGDKSAFHLGTRPVPAKPPMWTPVGGDAFHAASGDTNVRYLVTQDPSFDSLTFDPNTYKERIMELSELLNSNSTKIESFKEQGGKIILVGALADGGVSPFNTINYYEGLEKEFGKTSLDPFVRFYAIPGYGHGTGPFTATMDTLGALDKWVVSNEAPDQLVATDANKNTVGRTRPACRYPEWPKYNGSGDVNAAESYTCTKP
ncbi:tannase/feruloyl esterase family alpha/beta hydrolase [Paenibacillus validus]|uniref:tannase/feruloyl esterase family alpha/beta hydrolase n=1 Tax=Paenibacillus TaxID=44249 RepID=UPI0013E09128|nr:MULTISPECIES: tannase/feruloyl esterase family alpha/beta hydrolase [Paenibacillus]MED4599594.1 tannase/feruloyl esterase family alpha/beta hydrolase [Paenibacillus validus]MED4605909.1 tannase/feruloyl esterase family alpha/beta hydrolase [Paenibacillus validus]